MPLIVSSVQRAPTVSLMGSQNQQGSVTLVISALEVKTHPHPMTWLVAQDISVTKEVITRLVARQESTSPTGVKVTVTPVQQAHTAKLLVSLLLGMVS